MGTCLIELLKRSPQYELLNIDKNPSKKYPEITQVGNVMDKNTLINQLQGVDIVILLAAEHRDDVTPTSYIMM